MHARLTAHISGCVGSYFRYRSVLLPALVVTLTIVLNTGSIGTTRVRSGQGIPIVFTTPSDEFIGAQTTSGSVSVNSVPSGGCYVQVGCDHPSLVTSPSGSWPYNLQYPNGGSSTQTMSLTLSAVSQDTVVVLYACKSGVDSSNPANWTATKTITLHP